MGEWGGADNFGEKGFRFLVAVQQAAFAPLFVIDDALDREARPRRANSPTAGAHRSR